MAKQNQAVVTVAPGEARVLDVPYPKLPADDYMIVRTTAVAVNPTDMKHVELADKLQCVGAYVGCDYAGVVEEVGPGVAKPFKKGDRVCGPVNGSNALRKEDGAFGKYIIVKADLQIPTPDNLTDEQAATLGIAITTIGQALYQTLKLPLPTTTNTTATTTEKIPILIYGGSTAMGITGIQFASLSGLTVITTASPHNHAYLESLGADHVVDYNSPTAVDEIRAVTGSKLRLAWDCYAGASSAAFCGKCLSSDNNDGEVSKYSALLYGNDDAVKKECPRAETAASLYYSVFGEAYFYKGPRDAIPENHEFGKMFWELSRGLLADGRVKPIRTYVNRGGSGLDGVVAGLKELKDGNVSAGKLVYTIP